MPLPIAPRDRNIFLSVILTVFLIGGMVIFFFSKLAPASASFERVHFEVASGEGIREIASKLRGQGLIRSQLAFKVWVIFNGNATNLKPGIYELSPSLTTEDIAKELVKGPRSVGVRIPEGATIYEIDAILSEKKILNLGEFSRYALERNIEGRLFPDTYQFYEHSRVEDVVQKILSNFEAKVGPILNADPNHFEENLIIASILEKEVPEFKDRQLVAGVLKKRLQKGMRLQVDATICYAKEVVKGGALPCYPLNPLDFEIKSPYNTYLYTGWPPGSIGSPGISAIQAALTPTTSTYLFYLSDPATKKTIFARTFEEHNQNRERYLRR